MIAVRVIVIALGHMVIAEGVMMTVLVVAV